MLKQSRVSGQIDAGRLAAAVRRAGIDPRVWSSLAVVSADPVLDPKHGYFVDIILLPSQQPETAQVAATYAGPAFGLHLPLEKDDIVLVEAPNGHPDEGLLVTQRLPTASEPPPQTVIDNPTDVALVVKEGKTLRLVVAGAGNVVLLPSGTGAVLIGSETAAQKVVRGDAYRQAEDSFFSALNTLAAAMATYGAAAGTALAPLIPAGTALGTAVTAFAAAKTAFDAAAATYLAEKAKVP